MKEKIYYYGGKLSASQDVELSGDEFHHMANVMRTRVGESVCLFNGDGNFYYGKVTEIGKKSARIFVSSAERSKNEPLVNLTVFQALAKGEKLSLIAQKITELGASAMVLFESKNCDVQASTHKQERLEQISISAAKQCRRASTLRISGIVKLADAAQMIADFDEFLIAYENAENLTLQGYLSSRKKAKNVAIMIGPEGGYTESEIELLTSNGAKIISLGQRILRTETAAIAGTAVIMSILEEDANG